MTDIRLNRLEISNFRSIRGSVSVPLDAQTILVHGENGAGKTSLLSAIELALRGGIEFLELADKKYDRQLLHRGSTAGHIKLHTTGLSEHNLFDVAISENGSVSKPQLKTHLRDFYKERCYLPQALLNQLLKIYQDSNEDATSPLSNFVSTLLGLERLDSIEAGLGPVDDIRNLRKISRHLQIFEGNQKQLEREIKELRDRLHDIDATISEATFALQTALATAGIGYGQDPSQSNLPRRDALSNAEDTARLAEAETVQRRLHGIRNEHAAQIDPEADAEKILAEQHRSATSELETWRVAWAQPVKEAFARVSEHLPEISLPSDPSDQVTIALADLSARIRNIGERSELAQKDVTRESAIEEELAVARSNATTADEQIARISKNSGILSSALADIAAHIADEICPVCERDFSETEQGSLSEQVNHRVRGLSVAAEHLLSLASTKTSLQQGITDLEREALEIRARKLPSEAMAELDRKAMAFGSLVFDLQKIQPALVSYGNLSASETLARRRLNELQVGMLARKTIIATLSDLAKAAEVEPVGEVDTVEETFARIDERLDNRIKELKARIAARQKALEILDRIDRESMVRKDVETSLKGFAVELAAAKASLERAAEVRTSAQSIKSAVETVRSRIIRREFNERLNALWRDVFVRLAPSEPFVPAFLIPDVTVKNLQPKLITQHRLGGQGGTPGAMLSAGNLNTAALSLFISLHLSMKADLPWLILDDPVQSMDDIHIAHFAALLRTLAKEHGRQVIIAVHDRQLFEYLRLELSPAFETDTLRTLELSRKQGHDTLCLPHRFDFKKETALRAA